MGIFRLIVNLKNIFYKASPTFINSVRNFGSSETKFLPITSVQLNIPGECVKVGFDDGKTHEFPWLFLQDNCTCPNCFHPSSQSRLRKITELNLSNSITNVEFNSKDLKCFWKDGHESIYDEKWLKDRRFAQDNIYIRKCGFRDEPQLIGTDYLIQRERFDDVLEKPSSLLNVLKTLSKYGVFLIEGAPKEVGQLRRLADKIGFIRLTHYGNEFTVKSERKAVNLAYTSKTLGLHTDLPYYVNPPGTQLLHCIKQYKGDEGGQSHLVDGFLVAEKMRQNHPEEFKTLAQVSVEFFDIGKDYTEFHKVHHSPIFVLNPETKKMTRIVYSNQQLSSYQPIPLEKVKALYQAMKVFSNSCYQAKNLIKLKLKEGEILFFDNWRFLHGREGFDPSLGDRHLEGCYIDWDEIFSRIRVLQKALE